jgi:hypothetical protein
LSFASGPSRACCWDSTENLLTTNALTAAKDLAEIIELQGAYWRKQFDVLASQAEEVRSLGNRCAAKSAKEQVTRGMRH